MITILNAAPKHGYTGFDHMLTGRECQGVIGREFRSVAEARAAAEREFEANLLDKRVSSAPIWLEIRFASGEVREF